jgi:FkbM family methyltransferase
MQDVLSDIRKAARVLGGLLTHPASKQSPTGPLGRFVDWQLRQRVTRAPLLFLTPDGMRLRCYRGSRSASSVYYLGYPDWDEMHFLRRVLRPGDGFIDVGANVGVYSLLAASRVFPGGRIVCIEPDPLSATRLRENFSLNGLRDPVVHEVCVGASNATLPFASGYDTASAIRIADEDSGNERVQVVPLDSLVDDPRCLTVGKIDIEGYEHQAFLGAQRLLELGHPRCWLVETNDACRAFGSTREPLRAELARFGFRLYALQREGRELTEVASGGPFPTNSIAVRDVDWLRARAPRLRIWTRETPTDHHVRCERA